MNEHKLGTNEHKVVLKDHDHTVECIAWAPESAFTIVCEAAGNDVSKQKVAISFCLIGLLTTFNYN